MGDTIGIRIASISTIEQLGISLSITLAIVSKSIAIVSIGSKSLGGGIKSLGDWVKTSAGGKWNASIAIASISSVQKSRISLSITLAIVSKSIAIVSIGSNSLGGGIKSLGDWVTH